MSPYDSLVRTGAIASYKRDALLEAVADVWFLDHIKSEFAWGSGIPESEVAPATVRLVRELTENGLVWLATWGDGGKHVPIERNVDDLKALVESLDKHPFEYFLTATSRGEEWVARYRALVQEL